MLSTVKRVMKIETEAFISVSPQGKIKLEYTIENKVFTILWEPFEKGIVLETEFDFNGGILKQNLIKGDFNGPRDLADRFIEKNNIEDVRESVFEEVKLQKRCPKCNSNKLIRYSTISGRDNIPIIPTYVCGDCNSKSYYLTDEYLERLIKEHKDLFEDSEIKELDNDEENFKHQIAEYISRVMAIKKVYRIK